MHLCELGTALELCTGLEKPNVQRRPSSYTLQRAPHTKGTAKITKAFQKCLSVRKPFTENHFYAKEKHQRVQKEREQCDSKAADLGMPSVTSNTAKIFPSVLGP